MKLAARKLTALAAALLLTACSATKLVYNNLDWFAAWQVGKYLDLRGSSEQLFESGFESLWRWHRGTQLVLYARDLRELAETAARPLTPEQTSAYLQRANDHAERAVREGLPSAALVFQALDDTQVAGLLQRVEEQRAERHEEDAELDEAGRRKRSADGLLKNLKRWLGALTPEQKQRVQSWVDARDMNPEPWEQYSQQWWARFAEILAARARAEFPAQLLALMFDPRLPDSAAIEQRQLEEQRAGTLLLSELSGTLSEKQRGHFQTELRELAKDLEILAAKTSSKAPAV